MALGKSPMSAILIAAILGIVVSVRAGLLIALILKGERMRRRERRMLDMGIVPRGSELRHGMVVGEDGRSVRSVSAKNSAWYRRLT